MFKDKLYEVLCRTGITQTQLHRLTGISKSAISQYLSGKNEPSDSRKRDIAEALGLEADYFLDDGKGGAGAGAPARITRMSVEDAARIMGLSRSSVASGLRDGVFPWGYAMKGTGESWVYWINAKRFLEIEGVIVA